MRAEALGSLMHTIGEVLHLRGGAHVAFLENLAIATPFGNHAGLDAECLGLRSVELVGAKR